MTAAAAQTKTALSDLSNHDWQVIKHTWARGIDYFVHKQGERKWIVTFGNFKPFRTKSAAYDAGTALVLAESARRAQIEERNQ